MGHRLCPGQLSVDSPHFLMQVSSLVLLLGTGMTCQVGLLHPACKFPQCPLDLCSSHVVTVHRVICLFVRFFVVVVWFCNSGDLNPKLHACLASTVPLSYSLALILKCGLTFL